jgi:hypothetical protein
MCGFFWASSRKLLARRGIRVSFSESTFRFESTPTGQWILSDNWRTNEVLSHARNSFEGYTFVMRTLEAWGVTDGRDACGNGLLGTIRSALEVASAALFFLLDAARGNSLPAGLFP